MICSRHIEQALRPPPRKPNKNTYTKLPSLNAQYISHTYVPLLSILLSLLASRPYAVSYARPGAVGVYIAYCLSDIGREILSWYPGYGRLCLWAMVWAALLCGNSALMIHQYALAHSQSHWLLAIDKP
jgi:hypothetical protein